MRVLIAIARCGQPCRPINASRIGVKDFVVPKRPPSNHKKSGWNQRLISVLPYFFLFFLALLVLVPIAPHLQVAPSTDSSVFLYIGDRILDGAVPYRDVWDHKGPLIYYIDALGLLFGGGSRWGVWMLELLAVVAAAWIGYTLFKRAFGIWPAAFAIVLFLLELRLVLDLGNLTEEFALPLQFLLLWLFWRAADTKQTFYYFLIGVAGALCFLLRPNLIGIPLAIALTLGWQLFRERRKGVWNAIAATLFGGTFVLSLVSLYFLFTKALPQLWDAVFTFNFAYNAESASHRLESFLTGFRDLPLSIVFGLAGWAVALAILKPNKNLSTPSQELLRVAVIGLPVEMTLTTLAGNNFPHYYMSWLPLLALNSSFLLFFISFNLLNSAKGWLQPKRLTALISISLVVGTSVIPISDLLPTLTSSLEEARQTGGLPPVSLSHNRYESVLNYIFKNVPADQSLLVWGNQVTINWLTDRNAPTRFAYQTPLFLEGYITSEKIAELISALEANPSVIIDTRAFIPPLDKSLDLLPAKFQPLYIYLQNNYVYAGTFKPSGWDLYLYHGEGLPLEQ